MVLMSTTHERNPRAASGSKICDDRRHGMARMVRRSRDRRWGDLYRV
jgi:hypothetical protein